MFDRFIMGRVENSLRCLIDFAALIYSDTLKLQKSPTDGLFMDLLGYQRTTIFGAGIFNKKVDN